ncbi:MAG: hypothetical protein PHR35_08905 [Kiritimatiellae bacterium]|nr:hypothetical protein [Kiritimatiellia bacterium]
MSSEDSDHQENLAAPRTDVESDGEGNKRFHPPGVAWLALLVLIAFGVFVVQVFGLRGHLSLLREKAEWATLSDEHTALTARAAMLRMECATNEVRAAQLQTDLAATAAELAALKTEGDAVAKALHQAQIDRDAAEAGQRRAESATNDLWNVVTTLASQTNDLRLAATALDDQCQRLRHAKTGLDVQIVAQTAVIDENRKTIDSLVTRTANAQTDWQRASRELADVLQRLAVADVTRSNTLARTTEMEKHLAAGAVAIASNDQRVTSLQQRLAQLEGERAKSQMQVEEGYRTLALLRDEMKKTEPLLTTAKTELARTQADATSLTKQRDDLQRRLDQVRGDLAATEKNLSEKRTENATMEATFTALTRRLRDERDAAVQAAQATVGASNALVRLADMRAREGELAKSIETLQSILARLRADASAAHAGTTNAASSKR